MTRFYQVLLAAFVSASHSMNDAIPAGSIIAHAVGSVPDGFLECNGEEFHKDDFPDLHEAIRESYGSTRNGYFKVPDLRGTFVRGWDHGSGNDPHASSRGDRGDGNTGSQVGTTQEDTTRMPRNGLTTSNTGSHSHSGSANTAGEHSHLDSGLNFDMSKPVDGPWMFSTSPYFKDRT
jgi:microcystin-dependent protein